MQPNILLMHGANLNKLGQRNAAHYGHLTLKAIENLTMNIAAQFGYQVICHQSNHEGNLIDQLQLRASDCVGIIINPGAFTHYSYALHDALLDTQLPVIEVHLSDLQQREPWRQHSVIAPACIHSIMGKKEKGYQEAIQYLVAHLKHDHHQ